ncbi:MAG: ABC transporter substrate-binding protein [Dehalococcoidia bacterium]
MTTSRTTLKLSAAIGDHPINKPLIDGTITVDGVTLDFQEVTPLTAAFRRMCRTLDYDVAEMAIAAYFVAREYGKPFTALPAVVLAHGQHQNVVYNSNIVKTPKDLEGKKAGTRGYTVTPGIWIRGMLKLEHGVDLDRIEWVASDEEHVAEYTSHDPPNVTRQLGANLSQMLAEGELAAGLWSQASGDHIKPFYADPDAATREFYSRYGVFPIDHVVVVKDAVLKENPWLARALYEALTAAKAEALRKDPHAHIGGAGIIEGDPLPYGLEANRQALQMLLDMCLDQHVLHKHTTLEDLFPLGVD